MSEFIGRFNLELRGTITSFAERAIAVCLLVAHYRVNRKASNVTKEA